MGYCPNCVVTKGLGSWVLGAGAHGTALGAQAEVRRRDAAGTGRAAGAARVLGRMQQAGTRQAGARGTQRGHSERAGHDRLGAAWACCWAVGCALGALSF